MDEQAAYCPDCGHKLKSDVERFVAEATHVTGEVIETGVEATEKVVEKTKPIVKEAARKTKGLAKDIAKKLKKSEEKS